MAAIHTPLACDNTCAGTSQIVTTPGPSGNSGANGANGSDGISAFTNLTAGFNMPAVGATVNASVEDNSWSTIGQVLYIENAGYMELVGKTSTTGMTLENLGTAGNASPGNPVASSGLVTPGGVSGVDGADGTNGTNGSNSFTVTTADFTMPAISATVAGVLVQDGAFIGIGQTLYISTAGYMICTAKASANNITLENTGADGNAAGGANIVTGSTVSPSGPIGVITGVAGGDLKGNYPNPLIGIGNGLGEIIAGNGTDSTALAAGVDDRVLIADSGQANGLRWDLVDSANIATGAVTAPKLASGVGFQSGMLMPYAGSAIPLGWLACDGSAVSRATYSALFTAIGVTWGAGDGFTTFNLPDLRGRTPIGDGTGSGLSVRTLGQSIGTEENTLITTDLPLIEPNTTITPAMSGATPPYKLHATQWDGVGPEYSMDGTDAVNPRGGTVGAPPAQTNVNNMQPSAVVKMIIKT